MPTKHLIAFIDVELRECSENSFRSIVNGRTIKDIETCIEINKILRMRQDLIFRMKYVPNTIQLPAMYHCRKMAIKAVQKDASHEIGLLE